MTESNKGLMLQQALDRGLITQDQYNRGISKLLSASQPESSLSKRKMLDLALERGLIQEEDYQRGISKLEGLEPKEDEKYKRGDSWLDTSNEEIENYDKKRADRLDRVNNISPTLRKAYEYFDPSGEELAQQSQNSSKGARNLATLPGAVADVPALLYNVPAALMGKQTYVPSQMIGSAIDKATQGYTKPETNMEKVKEAVTQSVLPMGALGKAGNLLARQGSKWLNKPGKYLQSSNALTPSNVAATAAGSAGTQQYLNMNPEANVLDTLGIGLLASLAGGKIGKNIDLLSNPSAGAARIFSVNPNKVANQLPDQARPGKFIPSTLADISDSDNINMFQNTLSKAPFLEKYVKNARDSALNAEQKNINKIGLEKALSPDETGELAIKGLEKYQGRINKVDKKLSQRIEEGLEKHAKPYEQPFIKTPEGDLVRKSKPKRYLDEKTQKKRNFIEHFTEESGDTLEKRPKNLVPLNGVKDFIKSNLKKFDMPQAQEDALNSKLHSFTQKIDDLSQTYDRKAVPYKSLDSIISDVQDAVTTWGQHGNVSQGDLKRFRHVIQKDIKSYLENTDPKLAQAYNKRNKVLHHFLENDKPIMQDIQNTLEKGDLNTVTKNLVNNVKNSGRQVKVVAKGLTKDEKPLLGYSLMNEMGKKNVDDAFDMFTFAKNYKNIKGNGKGQFKKLFSEEESNSIDRLARRMENIQEGSTYSAKSPTGYINKIWDVVRHPIKSGGGLVGSAAFIKLYTSPKFLNWLSKGALIKEEVKMGAHVQKLKKMDLGSKVINQQVRDLFNRMEEKEENKSKKKILHITPQKDKEWKAEMLEEKE